MPKKTDKLKDGLLSTTEKKQISQFLSTGCDLIDLALGGGEGLGIKRGKFIRFAGINSSGKSFNITELGACVWHTHKERANIRILDCEARNTIDTEYLYGVPREDLIVSDGVPETVEEFDADLGLWLKNLKKSEVGVYGVDSLESFTNEDIESRAEERLKKYEAGKDISEKGTFGMQTAKFFSQSFFRTKKAKVAEKAATVILLSQMRENVDRKTPYSPKYKTSGGSGILHWLDLDVELKVIKRIGTKEHPQGAVIELTPTKQTAPRPYRKCRYILYFRLGIDNIGSNLDYLFDLRGKDGDLLETRCKSIAWDGKDINLTLLKDWIAEYEESNSTDITTEAKKARKADEGKAGISVDFHAEYFRNHEDASIKESFCKQFGEGAARIYTRDELISAIEGDAAMDAELTRRVIEKWEAIEKEAEAPIANRKKRFG